MMFKKLEKEVEREVSAVVKDEEKVIFQINGFKVRKKLIFSILLSIVVFVVGLDKIESLRDAGLRTYGWVLAITFLLCSIFLFFTVIRKDPRRYLKQVCIVFISLSVGFGILAFFEGFSVFDVFFLSMIITAVSLSIYDIF